MCVNFDVSETCSKLKLNTSLEENDSISTTYNTLSNKIKDTFDKYTKTKMTLKTQNQLEDELKKLQG